MTGSRRTRGRVLLRSLRPSGLPGSPARSVAVLLACTTLAAGCGLAPGGGDSGDDTIVVMTWAPEGTGATNKPGMPAFARAYGRWINANGGLDGRKIKVLTCNDHNEPVDAAKCARQAVKAKAVAVIGSYSQHSESFMPHLEGAGIPYIGGYGVTDAEFTSPLSYPVNGGQPALLAGLGRELAASCGPVALVRPDTIAGDTLPAMLDAGLKAGGHGAAVDQRAAEDATEYGEQADAALEKASADSPGSSGASSDPDADAGAGGDKGCVVPALGDRTGTFMDSFRRSRDDYPAVRTATVLGSVDQAVINSTGGASSAFEGAYVTGWYPVADDARWEPMRKVIKESAFSDTRIDPADTGVQTTWIAYTVFRQAVESLEGGPVTADTLTRSLDDGLKIDTGGLTPTLRWGFSDRLASIGFPRLVNADVTLQTVRQGRLVAARDDFTDVTKTLENADVD
ncbi:ABC transporter substrate-binding protein [Streptomyces sp. NPDC086091]|uniref:ABC transporter substrate-binding protein n=1 Tax=Streptomyces sp. NPDC086091 TaxID=3365751 RepID=UPI0037FDF54C